MRELREGGGACVKTSVKRAAAAATAACFALCARCMRCNHITLSLQNLDCSWYSECDSLSELHGYRSAPFAASGLPKVNLVRSLPAAEPIHVVTTGNASSDYDTFVHTLAAALRARPLRPLRAGTRSMVAESSLDYFLREKASNGTHGVWAEFGVFKGASIRKIVHRHSELAAAPAVVHGFDSFRGLPERWDMGDGHWNPGAGSFHVGGRPPFFDDRIRWHPGWYSETAPRWAKKLAISGHKISFLHMDADLYSSSAQVLQSVENYLAPGAWIVFDELINYPKFAQHAMRALYEMLMRTRRQLLAICMQGPFVETDAAVLTALGRTWMTSWQGSHPQNALVQLL